MTATAEKSKPIERSATIACIIILKSSFLFLLVIV